MNFLPSIALLALIAAAPPARAQAPATGAPAGISPIERRRALLFVDLLIGEGNIAEAEKFISERLAMGDDRQPWLTRSARILADRGMHAEAARVYHELLGPEGTDAGLLLQAGLQEMAAGDLAAARRDLEAARRRSPEPVIVYYLSELAYARGDDSSGLRLAREALDAIGTPRKPDDLRRTLRLRARLGFDDRLHDDFGKAFDADPAQTDLLEIWADALFKHGLHEAAAEPLNLVKELSGDRRLRWRRLAAERLRRTGREEEHLAFLSDAAAEFPEHRPFRLSLAGAAVRARRWPEARAHLSVARSSGSERDRWAEELHNEVRRRSDHHAGPSFEWKDSRSARTTQTGLLYFGYPRAGLRLDAAARRRAWTRKSGGATGHLSGLETALSWESPDWTRTLDFHMHAAPGFTAPSPGAAVAYKPDSSFSLRAAGALRRAWTTSTEAVVEGAKTDQAEVKVQGKVAPRLSLSGEAQVDRVSVKAGAKATQTMLVPAATLTLLQRPFYAAASWRFVSVDASGDAAFFSALPLQRRARAQYGTVSAGKSWLEGRLRADAYAYNGHDPERGRRFGSFDLIGAGLGLAYDRGPLELSAGWTISLDESSGVGGRSQGVRAQVLWRWEPR